MLRQKETHSRQFQIYPRYSTSPTCWAGCGSEVTWVSWCLKLLTTWQFVQQRIQDDHKENRRLYITDLLWRESSGNCWFPSQRASNEESVSTSSQHRVNHTGSSTGWNRVHMSWDDDYGAIYWTMECSYPGNGSAWWKARWACHFQLCSNNRAIQRNKGKHGRDCAGAAKKI